MIFTAESITHRLRNNLYAHIQNLPFSYHDHVDTGDLVLRATSDIDAVRLLFSDQLYTIFRVIFMFLINFTLICRINLRLGCISLIIIPLICGTAYFFCKRIEVIYEQCQNQDAVVSSLLQEMLTGVRVVKAFARQEFESTRYQKAILERFRLGKKGVLVESLFWPFSDILCGMQIVLSVGLGTIAALNNEISVGNYVAFSALVTLIVWPMRNLGRQIVLMSRSLVSYRRLLEVLQTPGEQMAGTDLTPEKPLQGAIDFQNVCFDYGDEKEVLQDVSFHVNPGEVIAIIGSTGSGKTSLINLLMRFYNYKSGSISLDGMPLNKISRSWLRTNIGIVEQEPILFSRSVAENICYGTERTVTQSEIEAAAKAAAIHDSILSFEKGYQTIVGERGVTLSGGQKQRIAIARMILKNPAIMILDDALSAVDTETDLEIRTALKHCMKDRTVFIIGHRVSSLMDADQILVMDKGRIVQQGKHEELLREGGLYETIYTYQMRVESELNEELIDG